MKVTVRQVNRYGVLVRAGELLMGAGDSATITYTKEDGGKVIIDVDTHEAGQTSSVRGDGERGGD